MKTTVNDIKTYIEGYYGTLQSDEGLLFGTANRPVGRLMVCWMITLDALAAAREMGVDTIVTHEFAYFPKDALSAGNVPEFLSYDCNVNRIQYLSQGGLSVIRAHGTLDNHCVFRSFGEKLGLGAPLVDEPHGMLVYDGGGKPYRYYVALAKETFGLPHTRYTPGDPERAVRRIGLPVGGLGLSNNIRFMQRLINRECDLLIAGEVDNMGLRYALDSGVDMIETGHEISENPGLAFFADELREHFGELEVIFYENKPSWADA